LDNYINDIKSTNNVVFTEELINRDIEGNEKRQENYDYFIFKNSLFGLPFKINDDKSIKIFYFYILTSKSIEKNGKNKCIDKPIIQLEFNRHEILINKYFI
jgi:hypothetical protein